MNVKSNTIPSITSLHEERNVKDTVKSDVYNIVLNKCIEKILYTNRHTDKTYVIFEVPKFLIGCPLYDMKSCILYLISQLSQNKYMVEFIEPFYLYIDWGSVVQKTTQKQKPKVIANQIFTQNPERLKQQTRQILQNFPDTSRVEYVYADEVSGKKKKKNKKK